MDIETNPDYLITQMRVLTIKAVTFFYVSAPSTHFDRLDELLDTLLDRLYAAKALTNITESGPDIVRYYPIGEAAERLFVMEAGVMVNPQTQPAGDALVKDLPPYHCASVLLWGGLLPHIEQTYQALAQAIQAAGLERTGECRECTYWFEGVDSPNNLMGVYMGIKP